MASKTITVATWEYRNAEGKRRRAYYGDVVELTAAEVKRGTAAGVFDQPDVVPVVGEVFIPDDEATVSDNFAGQFGEDITDHVAPIANSESGSTVIYTPRGPVPGLEDEDDDDILPGDTVVATMPPLPGDGDEDPLNLGDAATGPAHSPDGAPEPVAATTPEAPSAPLAIPARPKTANNTAAWRAWAVQSGLKTEAEAAAMAKDELMDLGRG